MKRAAAAGLKIDVLVESEDWQNSGAAKAIVRRVLKQAAATLSTKTAELAIVLTDDAAMRRLNRNWRGVDTATNVLAFPVRNQLDHLGDIVLAYETVKREARRGGKPFDHHLAHLVVHGFLHLLGYDHANDAQARRMETTERTILRDLAVPDPYRMTRSTVRHAGQWPAKQARGSRARRAEKA